MSATLGQHLHMHSLKKIVQRNCYHIKRLSSKFYPNDCELLYVEHNEFFFLFLDERQHKENSEDSNMPERSIAEWLCRREKKLIALSSKGYARSLLFQYLVIHG